MINNYNMYPQLPAGTVSIFGQPPWLLDPLTTPNTDKDIPKDCPIDIQCPSFPLLPNINPFFIGPNEPLPLAPGFQGESRA